MQINYGENNKTMKCVENAVHNYTNTSWLSVVNKSMTNSELAIGSHKVFEMGYLGMLGLTDRTGILADCGPGKCPKQRVEQLYHVLCGRPCPTVLAKRHRWRSVQLELSSGVD